MNEITIKAPAKINLCLSVLGRRPDGYHEIEMLMQMVGLYDEVRVFLRGGGINVSCDSSSVPEGEGNIAWKAAHETLKAAGVTAGISIEIRKSIPVAAGLGGGSSDAAAVIAACNRLLGLGFGRGQMSEIGARIGMDVPFFFHGPRAFARGRGEFLSELPAADKFWVLLANPGFHTSTAWAYQNLNLRLTKKADCNKILRLKIKELSTALHNDLEIVTAAAHPVIHEIKDNMIKAGALGALMSGSGPTVFGIFETETASREAGEKLSGRGWFLHTAEALGESPLAGLLDD